ncbi:MAG: hypothetical protein AAF662_11460 [Pseudomonadota bacterium]
MAPRIWLITVIFVAMCQSATAGLITERYLATVTSAAPFVAGLGFGDTFEWSITYDSSGRFYTLFDDGPNLRAEAGGGDDSVLRRFCLDGTAGGLDCSNFEYSEVWQLASDLVSATAPEFRFSNPDFEYVDERLGNAQFITIDKSGARTVEVFADGVSLKLLDEFDEFGAPVFGRGSAALVDNTGSVPLVFEAILTSELLSTVRHTATVPVPSTFKLLCLGVLGGLFPARLWRR